MSPLEALNTLPTRADVWNINTAHCRVRYRLQADAEPDLLCRALNLFALQQLTPEQMNVQRQAGRLDIDMVVDGLSWHRAGVIAEKLRNLICVCSVELQSADSAWDQAALAAG